LRYRLSGNTDLLFAKSVKITKLLLLARKAIPNIRYRPINKVLILNCRLLIPKNQIEKLKGPVKKLLLKELK